MPISTSCSCGRKLNLKDDLAGKTVKCPQCGSALKVPDSKSTATAVATPPPRPAPEDSRIMEKPTSVKKKDDKAGPKVVMANFKSLEDFDDAGNLKKKKKEFTKDEEEVHEVGTTGGKMAEIAAEALKADKEGKPKLRCPGCGRGVKPDDVICTKCGTNIKTGRRLGESALTLTPKKILILLGIAAICAAGAFYQFTKIKPQTKEDEKKKQWQGDVDEQKSTIAKMTEIVNDGDPDHSKALPHIANLGAAALPTLCDLAATGSPAAKRKAVKLLEILAFNGYRTEDSVLALASLARDPDPALRDSAAEALVWSAYDLPRGVSYWPAGEMDPGKTKDVAKDNAMPFERCRETLLNSGVAVRKDSKDGKGLKSLGNSPPKQPVVPLAAKALWRFYEAESMQSVKLTRLIQTVRAGGKHLMIRLIYYLEQEPCKFLGFSPPAGDRERSFRCLKEITGRPNRRFDDWMRWWDPYWDKPARERPLKPTGGAQIEYPPPADWEDPLPARSQGAKAEEPK